MNWFLKQNNKCCAVTGLVSHLCIDTPVPAQTRSSSGLHTGFPPRPAAALPLRTPGCFPPARPRTSAGRSPPSALGSPPPASWSRRASPWWPAPGCGCSPWCCCCAASTTASQTPAGSRAGAAHRAAEALTCCCCWGPPAGCLSVFVCASISVQILFWGDYVAFHHLYSWKGSSDRPAAHNGCFINQHPASSFRKTKQGFGNEMCPAQELE